MQDFAAQHEKHAAALQVQRPPRVAAAAGGSAIYNRSPNSLIATARAASSQRSNALAISFSRVFHVITNGSRDAGENSSDTSSRSSEFSYDSKRAKAVTPMIPDNSRPT